MFTQDSIDQFLACLSENNNSPHTIRAYKADLMGFKKVLDDLTLKPTTWGELESCTKVYLNAYQVHWKPKTTNRKISALRSWAEFAGNPAFLARYRGPKPAPAIPHPIPEGINGVLRMIAVADDPEHAALAALCGLAGLRVAEALDVRPCDFDFNEQTLLINGKGRRWRTIPLSDKCWEILMTTDLLVADDDDVTPLFAMNERTARRALTRLADRARLSRRVASHDLRSTFATAAYKKTQDLRAVQELLGHADSRTTQIYTGISLEKMREAADVA